MINIPLTPLRYPHVWPPPDQPPCPPHRLRHIPLVGRVASYIAWLRRAREHRRAILNPIAEEIIQQLDARPTDGGWPESTEQRQFAKIIADAVCLEKGLQNPPAFHADDPFPLLIWGPFDDITVLIVRMKIRDQFKLDVPDKVFVNAWNDRWTIQSFIQQCDQLLQQSRPSAA